MAKFWEAPAALMESKIGSRTLQGVPKTLPDTPKTTLDAPKVPQDVSKLPPRGPMTPPRRPKKLRRREFSGFWPAELKQLGTEIVSRSDLMIKQRETKKLLLSEWISMNL